jgi:hypothetical protein
MKYLYTIIISLLNLRVSNAQLDLPITFDDSSLNYTPDPFGGSTAETTDAPGISDLNQVMKSVKGIETWAGVTFGDASGTTLSSGIDFASYTSIFAWVYSTKADITVRLKAENADVNTITVETDAAYSTVNTWQLLEFDFSSQANGTAALNTANTYNKLSIFFDFDVAGGDGSLFYVDNISLGSSLSDKDSHFELSLYPNPAKDIAMISSAESVDLVRVFDLTGRIVKQASPSKANFSLDVADLSKGVYFVKLNAGNKEATTKLIK